MAKNPLIGTPVASKRRVEDVILWESEKRYTRTCVLAAAGDYVVGEVIANETYTDAPSATGGLQPSFSDVICIQNITVPDGETREVAVLVRGPALLNLDEIERASDSESDADLKTRLADLIAQGVRFVREPAVQSTADLSS